MSNHLWSSAPFLCLKAEKGHGIITGDNGRLNPQGNANRAECATVLERFRNCIINK